jgi:hypothetical protein
LTEADRNLECIFLIAGGFFTTTIVILAAILSYLDMGYNPIDYTISELGYYRYKTLFSIGMVAAGCCLIPFFMKLERELINITEPLRYTATAVSIFTSLCISMVGIIPDREYEGMFDLFHVTVAGIAFAGSATYILLYSILMYKGHDSPMYKGPQFKRYMSYYGFCVFGNLIVLFLWFIPIIEWILFVNIITWDMITAYYLTKYKFSGIAGMYYKKEQHPEMLEKFEESLAILNQLNLGDDPMAEVLRENIKFIKVLKIKNNL